MRHRRTRIVVHHLRVVDRAQMLIGIALLHQVKKPVEVLRGLGLHQVEFICQRPPYISISAEPSHDVPNVTLINIGRHNGIAPTVVGVKQDQVGLDIQVAKLSKPLFEMSEERRIESRIIVCAHRVAGRSLRGPRKQIELRFVVVVLVRLRKHAHANLVERSLTQRGECLLLVRLTLMNPCIAGGAEREVRCSICVAEVMSKSHRDGAVISRLRRRADKSSALAIQRRCVAGRGVAPLSKGIGHEANLVVAVSIVEAIHGYSAMFQRKSGLQLNVDKRVAAGRSLQRSLKDVVLTNGGVGSLGSGVS